jgi:hypothetical protein
MVPVDVAKQASCVGSKCVRRARSKAWRYSHALQGAHAVTVEIENARDTLSDADDSAPHGTSI